MNTMNTPKSRQQWIYDMLLEVSGITYSLTFVKYSETFAKSSKTFDKDWKKANERFEAFQNKLQAEKDEVRIKAERKFIRNGLKTKYERLFTLQKQIDETERELESGVFSERKKDGEHITVWDRALTPYEKAMMRRTIKQLQSEISKIEGDYAEMKVKHSNDPDNPIEATQVVIFQLPDNGRK